MYAAVMKAPDTAAKLKAAEALIKKYPKSPGRPRLARSMAGAIDGEKDAAQENYKAALAVQGISDLARQEAQRGLTGAFARNPKSKEQE